jgi:hypothetical protein
MSSVVMMAVFLMSSKFILTCSGWKEISACVCHDDFDSVKYIKTSRIHHIALKCLCRCKKLSLVHFYWDIHFWQAVFLANKLKFFFSDNELYKFISPSICSYFLSSIDEIEHSCIKSLLRMSASFMKPFVKSTSSFPYYFIKTLLLRIYQFNNNGGNI